jgi:CheY-like chemotaxis protein
MFTDSQRLEQVLRNLLSNAFKFTERGKVIMSIATVKEGWSPDSEVLNHSRDVVAFSVSDTGIGIPPEKQQIIFEAFQQADGSTSRKYGGTGLGLAISREIARLLGGEIRLASALGQGSTFTLFLPIAHVPVRTLLRKEIGARLATSSPVGTTPAETRATETPSAPVELDVADDRAEIRPGDKVILIIEDDLNYARVLLEVSRERGFKGVIAQRGAVALTMVRELKPDAVTLDLHLTDLDGWQVLDRLKVDLATRHIPVHIISVEQNLAAARRRGAVGCVTKSEKKEPLQQAFDSLKRFLDRRVKNLLVVEDDKVQSESIRELIGNGDVRTTLVETGKEALAAIQSGEYDCIVLDLVLPDMPGIDVLEEARRMQEAFGLAVVIYTAREPLPDELTRMRNLAEAILVKSPRSPERLLDETARLLHRNVSKLPDRQRKLLEHLHEGILEGRKVLVVDDDIRNIFAMTSVLERFRMRVVSAENGKDAIRILLEERDIDVVLMDIMLPAMDGYTTIRRIREIPQFSDLPFIAVTAKAMKGDRQKCIAAGASDYLCKPVGSDELRSMLRVWLHD